MYSYTRYVLTLVAIFCATWSWGEEAPTPVAPNLGPVPAAWLFKNPSFRIPLINQSGTKMAAIFDTDQDQTGIMVINLEDKQVQRVLGSQGRDSEEINWLGDNHLLVRQSREKLYADGLFVVDAGNPRRNHPVLLNSVASFIGYPPDKPLEPVVWIVKDAYNEGKDYGPVKLQARTNVNPDRGAVDPGSPGATDVRDFIEAHGTAAAILKQLTQLKEGVVRRYACDRNGKLAFAITSIDGYYHLFLLKNDKWQRSPLPLGTYDFIAPGDVDEEVIVAGHQEKGRPRALIRANALSGEIGNVLYQDTDYDADEAWLYRDAKTRRIIGVGLIRSFHENVWFEPVMQEVQKKIAELVPKTAINVIGYDNTYNQVVVAAYSDRIPVIYLRYDRTAGKLTSLALTRPGVEEYPALPSQVIRYKTRDGHRIEAYLTLPRGASKENPAPLIVLPHGGPQARDYLAWNAEVQFFASRGYAVLLPNYRGSDGTRWQYTSSEYWDFKMMHNDVTDGARKLIQTGLVDPKRIAIVGTSFGGYLAVCGAAWEGDLYRCAVSIAGVSDWTSLVKETKHDRYVDGVYDELVSVLGDPVANPEAYRSISPINDVSAIRIPVFVAHGKEDIVVPVEQSNALLAELSRHNVPHRKFLKGAEGHGMYRLDNQVKLYTEIEKFLAENLK